MPALLHTNPRAGIAAPRSTPKINRKAHSQGRGKRVSNRNETGRALLDDATLPLSNQRPACQRYQQAGS